MFWQRAFGLYVFPNGKSGEQRTECNLDRPFLKSGGRFLAVKHANIR